MGPGLTYTKESVPRYLPPGPLRVRVRNTASPAHADLFLAALWGLRAFGGIGARTRRGFGTIAVDHPPPMPVGNFDPRWPARDAVQDLDSVLGCVKAAMGDLGLAVPTKNVRPAGSMTGYPCFGGGRYRLSSDHQDELTRGAVNNWTHALNTAGDRLWAFRHGASPRTPSFMAAAGQPLTDLYRCSANPPRPQNSGRAPHRWRARLADPLLRSPRPTKGKRPWQTHPAQGHSRSTHRWRSRQARIPAVAAHPARRPEMAAPIPCLLRRMAATPRSNQDQRRTQNPWRRTA
jgi:hypothetical protein